MSSIEFIQIPAQGSRHVKYSGDHLLITLELRHKNSGTAYVRTNLGHVSIKRQELQHQFQTGHTPLGSDWTDIPMRPVSKTRYEVVLPLFEVGTFEFKTYFCTTNDIICWADGANAIVKVEPAGTISGNSIYNAFTRQFGPNISGEIDSSSIDALQCVSSELDKLGFTVIPPSGTFRDLKAKIDFITEKLGFTIIQLLPIHPVPTTYAKMGRFGSPFAPLDFFSVDNGLAQFDPKRTPFEQFIELADTIHTHGAKLFIDLPADHTGWASTLQLHHPEWFMRHQDGTFESPGAWGVTWEDLCKLDFSRRELWDFMASVFLYWSRQGVDGFRCDAGYMIPAPAWTYIINQVRQQYPDTIFFLEGLGGGQDATQTLLSESGMNWAYSELFQNYTTEQLNGYISYASDFSGKYGALVNFSETHDNERLASKSKIWSYMRTMMAGVFSPVGCFGFANGVEWFATEKIDVHGCSSLNWGASENMVTPVYRLNQLLKRHPAFNGHTIIRPPVDSSGTATGLLRITENPDYTVLAIANPNEDKTADFSWNFQDFNADPQAIDLLSGETILIKRRQCTLSVTLAPAQVLCLTKTLPPALSLDSAAPSDSQWQELNSTVLRLHTLIYGYNDLGPSWNTSQEARRLYASPEQYLKNLYLKSGYSPVITWRPRRDEKKITPVPAGHLLLVIHDTPFTAAIRRKDSCSQFYHSHPSADGTFFAVFSPEKPSLTCEYASLQMNIFDGDSSRHFSSRLQLMEEGSDSVQLQLQLDSHRIAPDTCGLSTTDYGGYSLQRGSWGFLFGKYDAMLAANLNSLVPDERHILLRKCKIWVNHHDFQQELSVNCQTDFSILPDQTMRWKFLIPVGMGKNIELAVLTHLDKKTRQLTLACVREKGTCAITRLSAPIRLTIRPYIDDCINHQVTKASTGPEQDFPNRLCVASDKLNFTLHDGHFLALHSPDAPFIQEIKWEYSYSFPQDVDRNLDHLCDLFSPGFFSMELPENSIASFIAEIKSEDSPLASAYTFPASSFNAPALKVNFSQLLKQSTADFIVNRSKNKSIIAGYPWFLDWGRDTLICLRGLLSAGFVSEARGIIKTFAKFENHGTIPNMINGEQVSNWDTSDAPLWLIMATKSFIDHTGSSTILQELCGSRSLLNILISIVTHYQTGTSNGIRMNPESCLIYSPPHFTWMDTNYPACSPREGYPIEIQCLWIASLKFLAAITDSQFFDETANQAKKSLVNLYLSSKLVGFSDCLHTNGYQPADQSVKDDACRPNQLFAITLGIITEPALKEHILSACQGLIVPGALRTLADQPVTVPLPIQWHENMLNDGFNPYWGHYSGDEDTRRKPAYHNGTAWPWLLPSYIEALVLTHGSAARETAFAYLHTACQLLFSGCMGHLPEIIDGDYPHAFRGCTAQAWSITEFLRVHNLILNP